MDTDAPAATIGSAFSDAQPLRNFVVLSIVSFGLYPTYWLYKNLRSIKAHKGLSISPGWRTFAAFIPLIGLLFFKDQLQLFLDVTASGGATTRFSPWGRTLGFNLISAAMLELPMPWALLTTAAVVFLLPVQQALNEYWTIEQAGVPVRERFSAGETALLIACGFAWVLVLVAGIVGERLVVG